MNTAELIVELVLTGLLMLVVLLAPTAVVYPGVFDLLTDGDLLAPVIAAGFLLGVVMDRCADSILETWEARARCLFANSVSEQRDEIRVVDVTDRFPEDWMRIFLMRKGGESAVKWGDQLRVRIRIARSVLIIAPALATSALLTLWRISGGPLYIVWLPALQLVYLLIALAVGPVSAKPKTHDEQPAIEMSNFFPVIAWLGLQLFTALAVVVVVHRYANNTHVTAAAVGFVAVGAATTTLAAIAWRRITKTYMRFLWDFCRFELRGADEGPQRA